MLFRSLFMRTTILIPTPITWCPTPPARLRQKANWRSANGDLPVVVARPSIVVGHTKLGCTPSGSIFWVLRAIEALRFLPWSPDNRVDVVPADWVAASLQHLLLAPELEHDRYHLSAGDSSSVRWRDIEAEMAGIRGGSDMGRWEAGCIKSLTRDRKSTRLNSSH